MLEATSANIPGNKTKERMISKPTGDKIDIGWQSWLHLLSWGRDLELSFSSIKQISLRDFFFNLLLLKLYRG